jgi:hypothetical protein
MTASRRRLSIARDAFHPYTPGPGALPTALGSVAFVRGPLALNSIRA